MRLESLSNLYSCSNWLHLGGVSEPLRTRVCSCLDESGKLRGPLIPASLRPGLSKGGRGSAARLATILSPWGRGRASPGPRKVRLGAGCPTRATPAPCRRARESPLSQPGWDGAPCAPIPSRHSKPRTAASEVWGAGVGGAGTHAVSRGLGDLSAVGSRPLGL